MRNSRADAGLALSGSLAPRGVRVRVRDISAARLSVVSQVLLRSGNSEIWSLTRRARTRVGLSLTGRGEEGVRTRGFSSMHAPSPAPLARPLSMGEVIRK